MRRRVERTRPSNPPRVERIESLNINTEYRNTKREREGETNVCARTWNGMFFLYEIVFVVFMKKRTALFFGRKLASEKEARLDKIGWALYEAR